MPEKLPKQHLEKPPRPKPGAIYTLSEAISYTHFRGLPWPLNRESWDREPRPQAVLLELADVSDGAGAYISFETLCRLFMVARLNEENGFITLGLSLTQLHPSAAFRPTHAILWLPLGSEVARLRAEKAQAIINDKFAFESDRIDYDKLGRPVRLYPLARPDHAGESPRTIMIDPRYGFGRPVFADSKIRIDGITSRFFAGESVEELSEDTDIPVASIQEAIRFSSVPRHFYPSFPPGDPVKTVWMG